MEPEQTSDNAKPPPATTEQPPATTTTHPPRSYECNFCKRGFTNAQALGGHMNIHRKDKTKFKHSSSTTPPPPITMAEPPPPTTAADTFSVSHQRKLLSVPQPEGQIQLSLFESNIHHPGNPPPMEGDVDLELRLGHVEPPPESSSENKTTTTTRKFF
ncbi:hypothetical protein E3N88_17561 [Mikania micrantha]|uniref:C2H2-type domain-containing protein n=1 Tax=Mikania micrantha TaxID=192012 RepID=A0A5N6NUF9_9ASTR|nr:hypothetical protein E3N88_17561 [Mikania micrantha]